MIDCISRAEGISMNTIQSKSLIGIGTWKSMFIASNSNHFVEVIFYANICSDFLECFFGTGSIGEVPILLAKPQSYMNYSGEAVGPLAAYYQVPLRHILLVSNCFHAQFSLFSFPL
jgi:peptidyl-tRNA hydrolase, PTH1 family